MLYGQNFTMIKTGYNLFKIFVQHFLFTKKFYDQITFIQIISFVKDVLLEETRVYLKQFLMHSSFDTYL